jgi:hypothetical protein
MQGSIVSRSVRLGLAGAALAVMCGSGSGAAHAKSETVNVALDYPVGSIVIVNSERRLYYVTGPQTAIRYPVAVGKSSELWMGRTFVSEKRVDPRWVPLDGSDPVEGGDDKNPLGKRALYLDWSLLRIHGTPSRGSIGSATSNGCVRMLNEDVIELFDRVHIGAPVFAIASRSDAGSWKAADVGPRTYVNLDARKVAKAEEAESLRVREQEFRSAGKIEQANLLLASALAAERAASASNPPPPVKVAAVTPVLEPKATPKQPSAESNAVKPDAAKPEPAKPTAVAVKPEAPKPVAAKPKPQSIAAKPREAERRPPSRVAQSSPPRQPRYRDIPPWMANFYWGPQPAWTERRYSLGRGGW